MEILDKFPIWAVYVVTVIVVLVSAEIGFRVGIWIQDRRDDQSELRMTVAVVGGMLGLLAFLVAFTIGIVLNQHGGRKAMVVDEANAIGTAWLRAGFLEESGMSTARDLLFEYTDIRIQASANQAIFPEVVARSEEIHNELWAIMEDNVRRGNESDVMALVVESVNDVIDIHGLRLAAVDLRLPRILGGLLFVATILSFLLVGVASSHDRKRDTAAMILLALAFVAVLVIIVDLDRPQEGLLTVNQTAMNDLLRQITPSGQ